MYLMMKKIKIFPKIRVNNQNIYYYNWFSSYQGNYFGNIEYIGYILKPIRDSIWFIYSLFYTNIAESLWGIWKRNLNNFSGISVQMLLLLLLYKNLKLIKY